MRITEFPSKSIAKSWTFPSTYEHGIVAPLSSIRSSRKAVQIKPFWDSQTCDLLCHCQVLSWWTSWQSSSSCKICVWPTDFYQMSRPLMTCGVRRNHYPPQYWTISPLLMRGINGVKRMFKLAPPLTSWMEIGSRSMEICYLRRERLGPIGKRLGFMVLVACALGFHASWFMLSVVRVQTAFALEDFVQEVTWRDQGCGWVGWRGVEEEGVCG